jgi:hypothetical protein
MSPFGAVTTTTYNDTASPPTIVTSVNGRWTRQTLDGLGRIAIATDKAGSLFDSSGNMRSADRSKLDSVLNTDISSGHLVGDASGALINVGCEGMISSLVVASGLLGGTIGRYTPEGLTLLFWNKAGPSSTDSFPGNRGYYGVQDSRDRGHTFWGVNERAPAS